MVEKEVVITNYKKHILIAYFEKGKPVEIFLKESQTLNIGDIYIGKVKNIVNNIQAAFVEVSPGILGYYSLKTNINHCFTGNPKEKLQIGDEIVVQVERGEIKTKLPVLTSKFQFQGKSMVFLSNQKFLGISKKIKNDSKRTRLKSLGKQLLMDECEGVIFRTEAEHFSEDEIMDEFNKLKVYYKNIISTSKSRKCFTKLDQARENLLALVHVQNEKDLRVITDIQEVYTMLKEYHQNESIDLQYYRDDSYSLFHLKSLQTHLDRAIQKNVWLRSGGYLVIEPTEALTSIDVNTGKSELKKHDEAMFLSLNLEAAEEVCRQLRLRNISGMILVDFINMSEQASIEKLMETLRSYAFRDPIQCNVVDMTPLGLVEITRKRTYRPLHEQYKENDR